MKTVLVLLVACNINAYAFDITEKNPGLNDISIVTIIDSDCAKSGYFNTLVCVDKVRRCYDKAQWPKTVDVLYKLTIVNECLDKIKDR